MLEAVPVVARNRIRPPGTPHGEVQRPRLLALLDGGRAPVTLLAAPPGSGKSVLLAQWARRQAGRCAWVSLFGGHEADLVSVWAAIIEALRQVDTQLELPGLEELACPDQILARVVPAVLNGLADAQPMALVLDGLEAVVDPRVGDSLGQFLRQTSNQVRVLMASSRPCPVPLSPLRAGRQLDELPAAVLRFTEGEAHALLERETRTSIPGHVVKDLNARLDGWAVGLLICGRSAGELASEQLPAAVLEHVRAEILDTAAPEARDALVRCSVLRELRHESVVAVAGPGAVHALDSLADTSLLLQRVPDGWICHPVLRAAASAQLHRSEPKLAVHLHTRAARHLAAGQDLLGAADCAAAAGKVKLAARYVESAWPSGDPADIVERAERLGALGETRAGRAGAAAALALGENARAGRLLGSAVQTRASSAVLALERLQSGDLAGAAGALEGAGRQLGVATTWHDILREVVLGALELWGEQPQEAELRLAAAATAAARCGYQDARVRALDHLVASAELTGNTERARSAALEATDLHRREPNRSAPPAIAAAYLATTLPAGISARLAGPHAFAFAAHLRAVQARRAGDQPGFSRAQGEGRSVLQPKPAGPLLRALLTDQDRAIEEQLTARELVVLRALAGPLTVREIARELQVSHNTVKTQVSSLFRKLQVHDRTSATRVGRARRMVAG